MARARTRRLRISTRSKKAVVVLEDDEFHAGRGSFLNPWQGATYAFIMDGATLRGGGVGCVERLRNRFGRPEILATVRTSILSRGRERFAAEHGVTLCRNEDSSVPREV